MAFRAVPIPIVVVLVAVFILGTPRDILVGSLGVHGHGLLSRKRFISGAIRAIIALAIASTLPLEHDGVIHIDALAVELVFVVALSSPAFSDMAASTALLMLSSAWLVLAAGLASVVV
jgi:hypothetical protein